MQITDVRVRKVTKEGKMKAVVSITLDNEFVVHDIKVIEGEKGLFIAMPSRKAADGDQRHKADDHPLNVDVVAEHHHHRQQHAHHDRCFTRNVRFNKGISFSTTSLLFSIP